MNSWMDSVPDHLRWNPSSKKKLFLKQSAALYATYYHLQILIHRPFIPSFRNPSPTAFPSLAICTNAARSCCHVIEFQSESELPLTTLMPSVFTAAVVLLLNIWSGKRSGFAPHPQREIDDVQRCLNLLKAAERRWCSAGRYRDILMELASAGDLSFSDGSLAVGTKRQRDFDATPDVQESSQLPRIAKELRLMAGSRRVPADIPPNHKPGDLSSQPLNFELPMYATELGRLPIFGQFNFSESHKRSRPDPSAIPGHGNNPAAAFLCNPKPLVDTGSPQLDIYPTSEWDLYNHIQDPGSDSPEITIFSQGQPGACAINGMPVMDNDTLAMWSTAPTGFEINEWETYITNVDQMTHAPETFDNSWVESPSR